MLFPRNGGNRFLGPMYDDCANPERSHQQSAYPCGSIDWLWLDWARTHH